MAASVSWQGVDPTGFRFVDVTCDTSYPTGGYSVPNLGLSKVLGVVVTSHPSGYVAEWDATNSKLKMYRTNTTGAALGEVPAATSLNGVTVHLLVVGLK